MKMKKITAIILTICTLIFTINVFAFTYGEENLTEYDEIFKNFFEENQTYVYGRFIELKPSRNFLLPEYTLVIEVNGERQEYFINDKTPIDFVNLAGSLSEDYNLKERIIANLRPDSNLFIMLFNNKVKSISVLENRPINLKNNPVAYFNAIAEPHGFETGFQIKVFTFDGEEVIYNTADRVRIDEIVYRFHSPFNDFQDIYNALGITENSYGISKIGKIFEYELDFNGDIKTIYTDKYVKDKSLQNVKYNDESSILKDVNNTEYKVSKFAKIMYLGDVLNGDGGLNFEYNVLVSGISYDIDLYNRNDNNEAELIVVTDILNENNINIGVVLDVGNDYITISSFTGYGYYEEYGYYGHTTFSITEPSIIENIQQGAIVRFKVEYEYPDEPEIIFIEKLMETLDVQDNMSASLQYKVVDKQSIQGSAIITNNFKADYSINLFVGVFDDNRLIDSAFKRETVYAGTSQNVDVELKPQNLSLDRQYTVKMFCWDNRLNSMAIPLEMKV